MKQTVTALRQCLVELSPSQRRVLSLRAGLGPGAPLSRRQVARQLDLGVAQTGRIERRGLRQLDRLAGAGACGGAAAASHAQSVTAAQGRAMTVLAGGAATGLPPRFGVGGVVAHGGGDAAKDSDDGSVLGLPPPIGGGGEATLLVALGLLVVLVLLVRRELLRR